MFTDIVGYTAMMGKDSVKALPYADSSFEESQKLSGSAIHVMPNPSPNKVEIVATIC